eukprot:TRINITY_DN2341_c0_g1_i1.p1 TRINITY_DN2341_c0_g1~~TRINITY_DN2341_c0_g1_i1.p1  ORF type:complete len:282 (-),score=102.72 TRINITY_DN2341_c0_g1_i1:30-848(-)
MLVAVRGIQRAANPSVLCKHGPFVLSFNARRNSSFLSSLNSLLLRPSFVLASKNSTPIGRDVIVPSRQFSKKKGKGKEKDEEEDEEEEGSVTFDMSEHSTAMDKTIEAFKKELSNLRTGRATPELLSGIKVEINGADQPLKSISQVGVKDSQTLLIKPFDPKLIHPIQKAIRDSALKLEPTTEGQQIRVNLPKVTQEYRQNLAKMVSKFAEEAKMSLRRTRQNALTALKKLEKKMSKDDIKRTEKDIQKLTDQYTEKISSLQAVKEKDITSM